MNNINKIVFAISYLRDGGAERVTAALANEICSLPDWEVHLITYERDEAREYSLDKKILRHVLPQLNGTRIENIKSRIFFLRKTVKEIKPNCVVSLGAIHLVPLLTIAMVGTGIPLILSERNDPTKSPKTRAKRMLRMLSYCVCNGLVFQTKEAQSFFPRYIRRKSTVISNPITEGLPEPWKGLREDRIVNFCRLVPQKNLNLLIDAFSDVAMEYPTVNLFIYGDGAEKRNLEEKINSVNLAERICLPGYSGQIHEEILKAKLFVSSSDYEGISNSMLEAIALGVPTICTDCPAGGARETIQHGINGMLVPVGDRQRLADAIRTVLSNEVLAKSMSENGYSLRETLSTRSIADQWISYIKKYI